MNEGISIARNGIEQAERYLRFAEAEARVEGRSLAELQETRSAVYMLAQAVKELAGAVEQQERRIMRLEQRR